MPKFSAGGPKRPPTPPHPPILLPQGQKGYHSAPFITLNPSAYLPRYAIEVVQSYGAITEIRTPMHTWPTSHPLLACTVPHCSRFFRNSPEIPWLSHAGTILEVWSDVAPLAWLTLRPAPKRMFLWLLDTSTDPPFHPICSKKVAIDWAWAESSDDIFKIP